jgi:hypothetical protein
LQIITLAKRLTVNIRNVIAATVIHVWVSSDTAPRNFEIERKVARERAIPASNQSGRSLITERALAPSDAA